MTRFEFGWGDPVAVRRSLFNVLGSALRYPAIDLMYDTGYPGHSGNTDAIVAIKDIVFRTTGKDYKHVFVTNGMTGAINTALFAVKGYNDVALGCNRHYFSFYDGIAGINEMALTPGRSGDILINASPSNPEGIVCESLPGAPNWVVWDTAYHSPTYGTNYFTKKPEHGVMVGGVSKLLGLPGLRLGWVATNDDAVAKKMEHHVTYGLCGVNGLSQDIVKNLAEELNQHDRWDKFFKDSKNSIDDNKTEMNKLAKLFGAKMPEYGMFAFWEVDSAAKKLLSDCGVVWTCGSTVGADENWIRLNLAQSVDLTREMVVEVMKRDRV